VQYNPDDGVLEVFGWIVLRDPNVIDHGARATAKPGIDVVAVHHVGSRVGEGVVVLGTEPNRQLRLGQQVERRYA
jgi:hypothetical protein